MSTPETDKPRVQLEKMTPPTNQVHKKQLQTNKDTQHLEMLKQAVAHLEKEPGNSTSDIGNVAAKSERDEALNELAASKNILQSYESTFQ